MLKDGTGWESLKEWQAKDHEFILYNMEFNKKEVPGLFNDNFYKIVACYNKYEMFGLPYSGGWNEQPGYILQILYWFKKQENYIGRCKNAD